MFPSGQSIQNQNADARLSRFLQKKRVKYQWSNVNIFGDNYWVNHTHNKNELTKLHIAFSK